MYSAVSSFFGLNVTRWVLRHSPWTICLEVQLWLGLYKGRDGSIPTRGSPQAMPQGVCLRTPLTSAFRKSLYILQGQIMSSCHSASTMVTCLPYISIAM